MTFASKSQLQPSFYFPFDSFCFSFIFNFMLLVLCIYIRCFKLILAQSSVKINKNLCKTTDYLGLLF